MCGVQYSAIVPVAVGSAGSQDGPRKKRSLELPYMAMINKLPYMAIINPKLPYKEIIDPAVWSLVTAICGSAMNPKYRTGF